MAAIHQLMIGAAALDYRISRSLRFNSADSAYLSRTPGSTATDRRKGTISLWCKRGSFGVDTGLAGSYGTYDGATKEIYLGFRNTDKLEIYWFQAGSGTVLNRTTTAVFRDPNAWMHILFWWDTTQASAADRCGLEINNEVVTSFSTSINPSLDYKAPWCENGVASGLGLTAETGSLNTDYFDGLIAEVYFIDGQKLTSSSFGKTSANGVWVPKKYSGTFGTNGFYLSFANNTSTTTIGYDDAGGAAGSGAGSNDWTATNFSVSSGAGNDSLVDTPTNYGMDTGAGGEVRGNYCTMNPLTNFAGFTLTNGNLDIATTANNNTLVGTIKIPDTGLWKFEVDVTSYASGGGTNFGVINVPSKNGSMTAGTYLIVDTYDGSYKNGSTTDTNGLTGTNVTSNGDVWIICVDRTNGKFWIGRRRSGSTTWADGVTPAENGSGATTISLPSGDLYFVVNRGGSYNESYSINFGQRPWADTSTAAFKALCTQNLPAGTITTSGSFTGNAAADGPVVQINGVPTAMTINGNAVTFGTHADKLANGFKLRSSSASYNASGSNTFSVTSTGAKFKYARGQVNP